MGFFDFLFAEKREAKLMQDKTSRAIAIAVSYTPDDKFGKAVFKMKKDQEWKEFEVVLVEKTAPIVAGDQWIVKCDEDFTRIVTPQLKLSKNSAYRIKDAE